MGEIHRKWFTITWGVLLLVSVVMSQLMRHTDFGWVHNSGVVMLYEVVSWLTLAVTILLFVWYNVHYWRVSRRLFWRKWRRWAGNIIIGVAMVAVLLLAIHLLRADKVELLDSERYMLLGVFAIGGLIYGVARYKFQKR